MSEKPIQDSADVVVEVVTELSGADLNDLCDSTDAAIEDGGGFGWVQLPARDILERYWKGVMVVPDRHLFVARLDGVIAGTLQMIKPNKNNEAQAFSATVMTHFVAPWARSYGLALKLMEKAEAVALEEGFSVLNLDVRETQKAAIKLYEKLGYTLWGTHPYYARVNSSIIKGQFYYKIINPKGLTVDGEDG